MLIYVVKRIGQAVPVLIVLSAIVFGMVHLAPVDPAVVMAGGHQTSQATLEAVRERYHLDRPIYVQYFYWAKDAISGNLGESFVLKVNVSKLIADRLPISLKLIGLAFLINILVAFPLATFAAAYEGSWVDYVSSIVALVGASAPVFFTGIAGILLFSFQLGWLPAFGTGDSGGLVEQLKSLIMPSAALGLNLVALSARIMRSSLGEVLHTDYVRTAKAKGLSGTAVLFKHALRNSLLPVVTILGLELGFLVVGTVLVEYTFGLGGLGSLIVNAVQANDYPVVQGTTLFVAVIFMLLNLFVDVLYAVLDPRIQYI